MTQQHAEHDLQLVAREGGPQAATVAAAEGEVLVGGVLAGGEALGVEAGRLGVEVGVLDRVLECLVGLLHGAGRTRSPAHWCRKSQTASTLATCAGRPRRGLK